MTDLDLAAIRARIAAATPAHESMDDGSYDIDGDATRPLPVGSMLGYVDAVLTACAPTDLAALCDEVERLRAATSAVRRLHQPVTDWHSGVMARQECSVCLNSTGMRTKYPCPTILALDAEV